MKQEILTTTSFARLLSIYKVLKKNPAATSASIKRAKTALRRMTTGFADSEESYAHICSNVRPALLAMDK